LYRDRRRKLVAAAAEPSLPELVERFGFTSLLTKLMDDAIGHGEGGHRYFSLLGQA